MTVNVRRALLALGVFLLAPAALISAQEVGRIVYLEGDVQLLRDGEVFDGFDLQVGDELLYLDTIQTGFDGYVEVELTGPVQASIRIRENSVYYLEEIQEDGSRDLRVRVLGGTLEMAVAGIDSGTTLTARTQTAVLGVRGTVFDIITSPDEATLFGVREGTVQIATAAGGVSATAGVAVEALSDREPRREEVPGNDFDAYYARWTETRLQAFRSGAATFIRAYARRYEDTRDTFATAYDALMEFRPRLEDLVEADGASTGEMMRFRAEISPAIIRMRSILPLYETTIYRLRELQRFHDQGIGRTRIGDRDSTAFFRAFAMREAELLAQLSQVRTVFRLYATLEEQSFAGTPGGFGESPFDSGGSILDSMRF